jgi:uncharacterized protein YciI
MFILLNRYVRPLDEVDKVLPEHLLFQDEMYARGIFIVSGRLVPRTGGVTLADASSREELEKLLQRDPFVREGIAECEIVEFTPTRQSEAFAAVMGL